MAEPRELANEFDVPWPTWEMHPAGDEFVYLLEGDTELALASPDGEQTYRWSEPGQWHGTENRQRPPWDEGVA